MQDEKHAYHSHPAKQYNKWKQIILRSIKILHAQRKNIKVEAFIYEKMVAANMYVHRVHKHRLLYQNLIKHVGGEAFCININIIPG